MKTLAVVFSLIALAGCNTGDSAHRDKFSSQLPGEAAGKAAYDVQKGAKKAAKELSKDLKSFGQDARQGFQEEKQKDQTRKKDEPESK